MRTLDVAIGLAAAAIALTVALETREPRMPSAARDRLTSAVDDLWLQAVYLGADRNRYPEVSFAPTEPGILAKTRCTRPRPVITFASNIAGAEQDMLYAAIPHEMAHVMVCLDGDPNEWKDQHGTAWQGWLQRLVPREQAEDIIEIQAATGEQP